MINVRRAAIIGCGFVGSSIAFSLMQRGLYSELVLIDANQAKAEGEAMDLSHGLPYAASMQIYAGTYDDVADCAMVILTAGANQKPGETRLDLIDKNVAILKNIIPELTKRLFQGILLVVSNPVDVLTYIFHKTSGIPEKRIIGTGTTLDTARLQAELARRFRISPKNIHAYVYGEHGDSSFIPWSLAYIANNPINELKETAAENPLTDWDYDYDAMEEFVRTSGARVIQDKGATFYAIAISVCHICKCILTGAGTALTVSTMFHGEYGIDDVCLSTLSVVDRGGVRYRVPNRLTEEEVARLRHSADCLKDVIRQVKL